MLEGGAQARVQGPALLSVADAEVEEGHGRDARLRGELEPCARWRDDGGLRLLQRHGDGRGGLQRRERHADLRGKRDQQDGLGDGARRRARRRLGDADTHALEPEPGAG